MVFTLVDNISAILQSEIAQSVTRIKKLLIDLNDCENLGIKYVQQSESAIKHRIYFTEEFQELLQIF